VQEMIFNIKLVETNSKWQPWRMVW